VSALVRLFLFYCITYCYFYRQTAEHINVMMMLTMVRLNCESWLLTGYCIGLSRDAVTLLAVISGLISLLLIAIALFVCCRHFECCE